MAGFLPLCQKYNEIVVFFFLSWAIPGIIALAWKSVIPSTVPQARLRLNPNVCVRNPMIFQPFSTSSFSCAPLFDNKFTTSSTTLLRSTFQIPPNPPKNSNTITPSSNFNKRELDNDKIPSHVLTLSQIKPILKFNKNVIDEGEAVTKRSSKEESATKLKVLNMHGLYCLFVLIITMPVWIASMHIIQTLGNIWEEFDPRREKFDYAGKIWCKCYLHLTDSYPLIRGNVESILQQSSPQGKKACLFVANHASFLDIAVICTVLDPVFKFIAKDSLKQFPGVGKQLVGGQHVLIDRTDKRSQLRTFKKAITYLQSGIPIMAFPEGKRSPDGKLLEFKGGIFSMAIKAKVPIIPLSISNTHAVMPSIGLLPVQNGRDKLEVYVHESIDVEGRDEDELAVMVRKAILSELPLDQHPLGLFDNDDENEISDDNGSHDWSDRNKSVE